MRIKEICAEKSITFKCLAEKIGVLPEAISRLVNGGTNPTISTLQAVATALDVDVVELFERKDEVRLFAEYQGERIELTHSDIITLIEQKKATR